MDKYVWKWWGSDGSAVLNHFWVLDYIESHQLLFKYQNTSFVEGKLSCNYSQHHYLIKEGSQQFSLTIIFIPIFENTVISTAVFCKQETSLLLLFYTEMVLRPKETLLSTLHLFILIGTQDSLTCYPR